MNKDINKMLVRPDKGIREVRGMLAKFYRQILSDLDVTPLSFHALMDRYLNNPRNGIPKDGKSRSSARSNLIKEISRSTMTWDVFIKCAQFLDPLEMDFQVSFKWRNKKCTVHKFTLKFVDDSQEDNESDGKE